MPAVSKQLYFRPMAPDKRSALEKLDEAVNDLRLLFRDHECLTEEERLFFENRLMILQIEYNVWAKAQKHSSPDRTALR